MGDWKNPLILPEERPAPRHPSGRVDDNPQIELPEPPKPPRPRPPEPPTRAEVEKAIGKSGTILGKTIPMVYGTATVVGHIGAWEYSAPDLSIGVIFAFGEQNSIATATTKLNGEVITSATGVSSEGVHVGDGSTALSSVLTGMTAWTADDTTKWQGYAHAVMVIDCQRAKLPGSFVFTSKLGGRKVTPIGGGAAAVSSNPAVIGYDVMTNSNWAGVATAKINETSWGLFEDWCNETMSDASARYEFDGVVSQRDPDAALKQILGHGLGKPYVDVDGKLAIWGEMAPPHIDGTWSAWGTTTIYEGASSAVSLGSITIEGHNAIVTGDNEKTTASKGAVTIAGYSATIGSEVSAGDYVYVGTNLRKVVTVVSSREIVLDSAVTVSGVRVRPISGTYIKQRDWVHPPAASETSLLQTPDKYRVRFQDEDNLGEHEVTATYGAGTDKIVETTLTGCSSAAVATRHAETVLKVAHLQPFYWSGVVGPEIGTALEPGDVLLFDNDVLTLQPARVLSPIQARPDGTYLLQLREYDPAAYSEATATTDTVPSLGTGFDSSAAPVIQQISTIYSSTVYDLIGVNSGTGRIEVGDTSRDTDWTSSTLRLPNNVPIYGLKTGGTTVGMLKMDTSDRLVLGDGGEAIYFDGTQFIFNNSTKMTVDWTSKKDFITLGASGTPTFGIAAQGPTVLQGAGLQLSSSGSGIINYQGLYSGTASAPTTTELPSDLDVCIWEETDTNTFTWFINDNTTIRQIS